MPRVGKTSQRLDFTPVIARQPPFLEPAAARHELKTCEPYPEVQQADFLRSEGPPGREQDSCRNEAETAGGLPSPSPQAVETVRLLLVRLRHPVPQSRSRRFTGACVARWRARSRGKQCDPGTLKMHVDRKRVVRYDRIATSLSHTNATTGHPNRCHGSERPLQVAPKLPISVGSPH